MATLYLDPLLILVFTIIIWWKTLGTRDDVEYIKHKTKEIERMLLQKHMEGK